MKKYFRSAALIILSTLMICFQSVTAIAATADDYYTGDPDSSYVEPSPDPDPGSTPEPSPDPEPEPDPTPDPEPSSTVSEPDYTPPSSSVDNGWDGNTGGDDYSFYESEAPVDNSSSTDSSGFVSDSGNDLYDVSKSVDSNEMKSSDWKLALDLDGQDGANDFNFIKNNKSADDENSNQWMLFLGIGLIAAALIGIISTIVYSVNKAKKNKASRGKGTKTPPHSGSKPQKHIYEPNKSKTQKYDTAEIDIDLGAERHRNDE